MTISIGTLLWKRHEVFRIWAMCVNRLIREFPEHDFEVVVVGSEGKKARDLVDEYDFLYFEFPNQPLGNKANERFKIMQELDPDLYFFSGSDDIISSKAFKKLLSLSNEYDWAGSIDYHFYNVMTNELGYFRGYAGERAGEPLAPWRFVTRDLVRKMPTLWDSAKNKFIDRHAHKELANHNGITYSGEMLVDIKTTESITPFHKYNLYLIDPVELYNHFPTDEINAMLALSGR